MIRANLSKSMIAPEEEKKEEEEKEEKGGECNGFLT